MGFDKKIIKMLQDGNPQQAIDCLLERYERDLSKALTMYGAWKRIRVSIVHDDANRNINFENEIRNFLSSDLSISQSDFEKIGLYLQMSLRKQHTIQTSRKPYLENREQDLHIKNIRPVFPAFYEFQLPEIYIKAKSEQELYRTEQKQMHQAKPREFYNFTLEEVGQILEKVLNVLNSISKAPLTASMYYDLFNAVQLVSGRRNYEIAKTLEYRRNDFTYQASVRGLAKNDHGSKDWIDIPLLCKYDVFEEKMDLLRSFKSLDGVDMKACDTMIGTGIRNSCRRLFGRMLTHTQKRNLYAELAWSRRKLNFFLYGNESCSKFVWFAKALGHRLTFRCMKNTQSYQVITINE